MNFWSRKTEMKSNNLFYLQLYKLYTNSVAPHSDIWDSECMQCWCVFCCAQGTRLDQEKRKISGGIHLYLCFKWGSTRFSGQELGFLNLTSVRVWSHLLWACWLSCVCLVCTNVFCRSACGCLLLHVADITNNTYKYECESFAYANVKCWGVRQTVIVGKTAVFWYCSLPSDPIIHSETTSRLFVIDHLFNAFTNALTT